MYSHTWDNKDSEGWAALFTDTAILQTYSAGELVSELSSTAERLSTAESRLSIFAENGIQTRHFQTNTVLTQDQNGAVSGITIFSVAWQYSEEDGPRLMHTGIYRDEYVKTPAGWRFSRREVRVDHK
jgi:3-phenylpropionate/cinnamic acid dioxygenase small subunit